MHIIKFTLPLIIFTFQLHAMQIDSLCQAPDINTKTTIIQTTNVTSNLIGKGGFGAVFNYQGNALKIVRVDTTNNHKMNAIFEEIQISKDFSDFDNNHEHFPNFVKCFFFGLDVSPLVAQLLQPQNAASPIEAKNAQGLTNFVYIGILMERLEKSLTWFMALYGSYMDLGERARMGVNLGDHLRYINDTMKKSHCDIKPDNFMLNQVVMKKRFENGSIGAYSLFFNDFQLYTSKVIDFGGVVDREKPCSTYTLGFVPFDDMFENGSINSANRPSLTNDMFALATVFVFLITKDRPMQLINVNQSVHLLIKKIVSLENNWYTDQLENNKENFSKQMKEQGRAAVRAVAINSIAEQVIQEMPDELELLKITWQIISQQQELDDKQLVLDIFTNSQNFLALLEAIYTTYFGQIMKDRLYLAKLEILRLYESYGLTALNYKDFLADAKVYVEQEQKFVALIQKVYNFFSKDRPDWNTLITEFQLIDQTVSKLHVKIGKAFKNLKDENKPKSLNFDTYKNFIHNVENHEISVNLEALDDHMRILAKNQKNKTDLIKTNVIDINLMDMVLEQTQDTLKKLNEKNQLYNQGGFHRFESFHVTHRKLDQLLIPNKSKLQKSHSQPFTQKFII